MCAIRGPLAFQRENQQLWLLNYVYNGKPSIVLETHEKLDTKLINPYIVININFCLLYCTYVKQIVSTRGPL